MTEKVPCPCLPIDVNIFSMHKANWFLFLLCWELFFAFLPPAFTQAEAKQLHIGVSLPTQRDERWVRAANAFKQLAKEKNLKLSLQVCDNDAFRQLAQCENLLVRGIDVLILAPHDASCSAAIVKKAHDIGVKVISYDRLVLYADVDLYISFDNVKVGRLQGEYLVKHVPQGNYVILAGSPTDNNSRQFRQGAMEVIQPLVNKGDIKIVMDQWVTDWQPSVAMNLMQDALTANHNKIDAVLAPNDNTAGGVIRALAQAGLDGKIPVTGQDSEITAAKRIARGKQAMTVFKDPKMEVIPAIESAILLAQDKQPPVNIFTNNKKYEIPSILVPPITVDRHNLDRILIDSGYMTKEQVY